MENLPLLQLSQAHLQLLETCPRKFQHCFLDSLSLPQPSLNAEKQTLGTQFHQLMQQKELGLDITPLLQDNPQLREWFKRFETAPPPLIAGSFRQSEYPCTLTLEDFTLVAVYDLLIQGDRHLQIVDWKTYPRPRQGQTLRQQWQTKLYLFMACEVFGYPPADISMVYWFAESPQKTSTQKVPEPWVYLSYSEALHAQTRDALMLHLKQLRRWLHHWVTDHRDFPQVPQMLQKCGSAQQPCAFVTPCQRNPEAEQQTILDLTNLAAIAEVSLESL